MIVILIMRFIVYLSGAAAAAQLFSETWGDICPECGANAANQAWLWPIRNGGGCEYCGTSILQRPTADQ